MGLTCTKVDKTSLELVLPLLLSCSKTILSDNIYILIRRFPQNLTVYFNLNGNTSICLRHKKNGRDFIVIAFEKRSPNRVIEEKTNFSCMYLGTKIWSPKNHSGANDVISPLVHLLFSESCAILRTF